MLMLVLVLVMVLAPADEMSTSVVGCSSLWTCRWSPCLQRNLPGLQGRARVGSASGGREGWISVSAAAARQTYRQAD